MPHHSEIETLANNRNSIHSAPINLFKMGKYRWSYFSGIPLETVQFSSFKSWINTNKQTKEIGNVIWVEPFKDNCSVFFSYLVVKFNGQNQHYKETCIIGILKQIVRWIIRWINITCDVWTFNSKWTLFSMKLIEMATDAISEGSHNIMHWNIWCNGPFINIYRNSKFSLQYKAKHKVTSNVS